MYVKLKIVDTEKAFQKDNLILVAFHKLIRAICTKRKSIQNITFEQIVTLYTINKLTHFDSYFDKDVKPVRN